MFSVIAISWKPLDRRSAEHPTAVEQADGGEVPDAGEGDPLQLRAL